MILTRHILESRCHPWRPSYAPHLSIYRSFGVFCILCICLAFSTNGICAEPDVLSITYQDDQGETPEPKVLAQLKAHTLFKIGEPLSRYSLRKSIEGIYSIGSFVQITVESQSVPGGIHLRVILEKKIRIRLIEATGHQAIKRETLFARMRFAPGAEYNATAEEREEASLEALYRDRGYFQADVSIYAKQVARHEVDLSVEIEEGEPTRISGVTFEGIRAFDAQKLRGELRSRAGDSYDAQVLADDVKRLEKFYRENGYLSVVVSEAMPGPHDPVENSVPITIKVEEGVKLLVSIEGNDRVSTKEIKKHLRILGSRYRYTDYTIRRNALDIKRLYQQRGYSWVQVVSHVDRSDEQQVRIHFLIEEGEQFRVGWIEFAGNEAFSDKTLMGEMRTQLRHWLSLPGLRWLFSKGIFDEETFKTDLRALELFYKRRGYRDVQIQPEHEYDRDTGRVGLRIHVSEGERNVVEAVTLLGNRLFASNDLIKGLQLRQGEPLNEDAAAADRTWIENRYQQEGYIRCTVTPYVRDHTITYQINEGPQAVLGDLRLRGNKQTKAEVITREFRLERGEVYDAEEIAATRQRIFGLGLFRDIDFTPLPAEESPEKVTVDLDISVNERPAGTINLRGGYSPSEQIRGTLGLAHRNLYGRGRRIGSVLRLGTGGNLYEVHFVEPWLFHTRTRASLRLFRDRREELDDILATGGMLTMTRRFGLRRTDYDLALQYRYETLEHPSQQDILVSSIGTALQRDTRDDPLDATRGSYHQLSIEYAGADLGGNSDFIKLTTDHRAYFRQEDAVIALAARLGYGEGLRSTKEITAAERFHAGGPYTLRGFSQFSLGEQDATGNPSGDVMLILNAEIRFPIRGFLGGSFFVDVGNIWGELADLRPFEIRSDVGLGLHFATPIGPLRVDYGFPLVRRTSGGIPGKLWFVLGQAF